MMGSPIGIPLFPLAIVSIALSSLVGVYTDHLVSRMNSDEIDSDIAHRESGILFNHYPKQAEQLPMRLQSLIEKFMETKDVSYSYECFGSHTADLKVIALGSATSPQY